MKKTVLSSSLTSFVLEIYDSLATPSDIVDELDRPNGGLGVPTSSTRAIAPAGEKSELNSYDGENENDDDGQV